MRKILKPEGNRKHKTNRVKNECIQIGLHLEHEGRPIPKWKRKKMKLY